MIKNRKTALPQLRFRQFKDYPQWNIDKFGNLIVSVDERAGAKKYTLMSVTSGVGLIPQIEKFGREIAGSAYKNYYVIKKNDFAYNKSATKQFPEGYISMLTGYEEAALPNSIFTCFRITDDDCDPRFFDYLFHNNYHGSWLRKYIEVGARSHGALSVDTKHIWNMPVALPKFTEQQKIADCLSSLDDLITIENKKLLALRAHKKGLMQKIFSCELRFVDDYGNFFPKWKEEKLSYTLDSIIDNRGKTPEVISSGIPLIEVGAIGNFDIDYSKIKKYVSDEVFNNWFRNHLKHGDILFSTVGKIGLCSYYDESVRAAVAQNVVGLRFLNEYNSIFMLYLLTEINNSKYIQSIVMSAVQPSIKVTQFTELVFSIPTLPEQQKIADCLSGLDSLITAQAEKIEALKAHKKGLIQGLFPSIEVVGE